MSDTAIVATDKSLIANFGKNNVTDTLQNEMMATRWKVFKFFHQIPKAEQVELPPYWMCFFNLTSLGQWNFPEKKNT